MKKMYLLLAGTLLFTTLTGCGTNSLSNAASPSPLTDGSQPAQSPASDSAALSLQEVIATASNSIIVNSSEKVSVVPDIAEIVYSVRTSAGDAASCQQQNTASVNQVIECLKSLNIQENSIQTSDYYMNPIYNYSNNTSRITGYEAITTLTVADLPIDRLDEILSQSVLTGVNTIQSITYQASKYDQCYQEALAAAVESARQKAQILAEAAGCSIGAAINITETSGYSQARYSDYALTSRANSAMKQAVMEDSAGIMAGEIQVEAAIQVEYQLR